ncbi:MAG: hypothetical protein EZS28_041985, partial [Streblomastix strix]
MSACANAIKYALAYWDFKLDQDYTPKDDYASFISNKIIGTQKFNIIWIKIREKIETQATTSKNQIVRSTEKYSYRQDAIYARHDSQARIHQHQI